MDAIRKHEIAGSERDSLLFTVTEVAWVFHFLRVLVPWISISTWWCEEEYMAPAQVVGFTAEEKLLVYKNLNPL